MRPSVTQIAAETANMGHPRSKLKPISAGGGVPVDGVFVEGCLTARSTRSPGRSASGKTSCNTRGSARATSFHARGLGAGLSCILRLPELACRCRNRHHSWPRKVLPEGLRTILALSSSAINSEAGRYSRGLRGPVSDVLGTVRDAAAVVFWTSWVRDRLQGGYKSPVLPPDTAQYPVENQSD